MANNVFNSSTVNANGAESSDTPHPPRWVDREHIRRRYQLRTFPWLVIIGALLGAAALLLGFTEPAYAGEPLLVSNTEPHNDDAELINLNSIYLAQGFETGSGLELGSIEVHIRAAADGRIDSPIVKLYSSNLSNEPSSALCTLTNPSSWGFGIRRFGAASCPTLTTGTRYFVFIDYKHNLNNGLTLHLRDTNDQNPGAAQNWRIDDAYYWRHQSGSDIAWKLASTGNSAEIRVREPNTLPTASDGEVSLDEDEEYAFSADDFGFDDSPDTVVDTLNHVKITSPLAGTGTETGTLLLDGGDGGISAASETNPVEVTKNQLEAGELTYTPPLDKSGNGFATFKFKVNDGFDDSTSEYTMTIDVNPVNDAPVVSELTTTPSVAENTPSNRLLATYTAIDPEGDSFEWSVGETLAGVDDSNEFSIVEDDMNPSTAYLYFNSSRDFESPKDEGEDNIYEVRVQAYDDDLYGGLYFTITVTDVEVAAEDDTATTDEDTEVVIDVLANDTDDPVEPDDPSTLTVTDVGTPTNGTVAITGTGTTTTVTYTPTADFHGADTFTYSVSNVQVETATGTVTVTVNAVNDAPVATADTATTNKDQPVVIRVLENDTDVDEDTLTVTAVGTSTNGTVAITGTGTTITYTPNFGYIGDDTFTYTVFDGTATATGMVTMMVTNNADLSNLTITIMGEGGSLTPTFVPETRNYAVEVAHSVSSVTVTPIASDSAATVTVNGTSVTSSESFDFALPAGARQSTIEVAVTNEGYTKTYTIQILRPAPPDVTRPRVEIQTEALATVGGAFEVTILFSEPVKGFALEDIEVSNGTASNFNRVSPRTYTVTTTPEGTGEVRVEVPENGARDGVGNRNRAAEPLVIEADLEGPKVTIEGPTEPVGGAFEVTILFSEPVEDFALEDIEVSNGTASNFNRVSPRTYTVTITPEGTGEVRVEIPENVARDGVGNDNQAAEPLVIEADLEGPKVTIEGPTEPVGGAFEVTILFSEPVEDFALEDIEVSNGTASNFNRVSPRTYTVTTTPEGTGEVRVEVPENVAEDGAGNGNQAAEPLVIEADLEGPKVTIEGPTEPVGGAFEVTILFSEPVEDFALEDIEVSNGTASNFNRVSPRTYTVTITPEGTGEVRVEVPENVARDGVGNDNQAAEPLVIEADLEGPKVTIEGPTEPVGGAFEVTILFSEPVEDFALEDIEVSNGTASNFNRVSPRTYTVTITPEGIGEVRVEVPENGAEDGAGNDNQAAEAFELETKLAVSYQEESYTAREGGEAVTVTVKLSQGWDEELAIPIRVRRPETTEVADYTLDGLQEWDAQEGAGRLTFPAAETEQTFTIEANHDGDGDDETVELGFGELPEIVLAGEPGVATVMLEDKGLVELKVSFRQAEYQIREGQQADIEMKVAPTVDRRVEVPLVVSLKGGASEADYSGVPVSLVIKEGESEGTISVEVLADEVNDPGEGIVLSFGELPEAVSGGEIPETTVNFRQQRTAEQFSQTLEVALALMARSMGESVQTAIEGRFERYRQWSRLGAAGAAVPTAKPGSDNSATGLGEGESQRIDSESLEGASRRRTEGPVVPSAGGGGGARAVMGSSGESGDQESGVQGAWLQNVSLGGLAGLFGYGQGDAGVSLELPLAGQQKGTSGSWSPALWVQGDLQHFNGNLTRHEMSYRGGLEAAHVGLDLYANDKVLAGLSFMRSWGNTDYSDDGIDGVLRSRMNTLHPYLYWQPAERVSVWGMGGLGRGRVDVNEPGRSHDFDADFRMFSGGVRTVLSRRGSNEVGLRADAFWVQLGTEVSEDIAKVRGEAHRARLMLEWVHTKQLSVGRSLSLKAEAGGRFDGGDAERGSGAETGFRLGYLDANSGLDVAMLGRVLVVHASDYRDWGLGVQASWDPGEKQRGFRVSVTSTRGQDGGGRTTLWNNANMVTRPVGMDAMGMNSQSRMESEVAYGGLKVLGLPGLLTSYSRLRWAGQGRELTWGTAWSLPPRSQLALPLMLEMEAIRRENRTGPADLAVLVRMSIPF